MTHGIMHRRSPERNPLRPWSLVSRRQRAAVTLAVIQRMIDVPVKIGPPVIPRPGADEHSAVEPLRPVITIRRAVVGRRFVIAVGADGRPRADAADYAHARSATRHENANAERQ